ncbi:MAG: transketolase family protein [Clostridia bacterium]|nr:transketolase family protein [Clostridia bacterium]
MKMKPTRDGYGEGLLELGRTNPKVLVLDADLSKSTRTDWFQKEFPERFFDIGISEQDMLGTAAGLALAGKIPFVTTYGVFVAGRAWDQIRTTIAYGQLNVKIAGAHGGISVGADGATHQALEEIALMRVLPHMTLVVPCDSIQTKKATVALASFHGPAYLRFAREATPVFTDENDPFEIGNAITLKNGTDLTIIACGPIVYEALKAAESLNEMGIFPRVINMHTVKPLDEEAVIKAALETGAIVTAEEHQVFGGLGGAVAEVLVQNCPVPVEMVGIKDTFGESGTPEELAEKYGLTARHIVEAAKKVLKRKPSRT